jgi:hypothetical protein
MGHGQGYSYPHAYQDHWVAQKYLPETLQGKVFFKPSNQGREKIIRREVEEKRELQYLAQQTQSHSDINSIDIGWTQGVKEGQGHKLNKWLQRSLSQTEVMYQQVRDKVFQYISELGVSSEGMVLDLSGDLGFLTWEACRRFSQGGVWSLCSSEKTKQTLEGWVKHFEYFVRPHVVCELTDSSIQDGTKPVLFDGMVGYNFLKHSESLKETRVEIADKLNFLEEKGVFVFTERDVSHVPNLVELFQSVSLKNIGNTSNRLDTTWKNMLESLQTLQRDWKQKHEERVTDRHKIIEESFKDQTRKYFVEKKMHVFHFPRTLEYNQLKDWLDSVEDIKITDESPLFRQDSLLVYIKDKLLEEKQWALFKEFFLNLAGNPLQWEQGYYFWIGRKL